MKTIEERHLNLKKNVKVLLSKEEFTLEEKKKMMASFGKKDGMKDHMRSIGEDGEDQMEAGQIMSEEEGKMDEKEMDEVEINDMTEGEIDERLEEMLLKYLGHVNCENDSRSEDEVQDEAREQTV